MSKSGGRKGEDKSASALFAAVKNALSGMGKSLKEAVFPENVTCDCCGGELVADTRYRLCASCLGKMPFIKGKVCVECGSPLYNEADYCIRCQNSQFSFYKNRSVAVYDGVAQKLVHDLKFGKRKYIADTMAAMAVDVLLSSELKADIIVFVPMSEEERKARGFNQAELLARGIGERLGIAVLPALVKTRNTSEQKSLGAKQRRKNLKDAFECVFDQVRGRDILLVDDVFTTGATVDACAEVLLKHKARSVSSLTFAIAELHIDGESAI